MVSIGVQQKSTMGKKINNPKLLKKQEGGSMASAFNQFANKLAQAKRRKIEKVGDTKQRLMEAKRTNKMLKVSKRTSKFALLQDQPAQGLTHRGQKITDLKEFNDINFGSDEDDEHFQEMHDQLNFTGFDEEGEEKPKDDRPKSKNEVYKEIIEKSRMHKYLRQELYEENLEKATALDQEFPELATKLQFRTRDSNVKDRLASQDHEFEKLANELKDDHRVVSNKVIQKTEKYTDKMKQKKTQQLNALLKDSSDEEADIRTWVKKGKKQQQDAQEEEEDEEDEIDEVQLSSGDEGDEDEQEEQEEDGEEEDGEEVEDSEEEEEEEEEKEEQEQDASGSQSEDDDEEQSEEVEEQSSEPPKKKQISKIPQKTQYRKKQFQHGKKANQR